MSDWIERIREVEARAGVLEARMSEPEVATQPAELATLGKELAGLRPLLETGRAYLEVTSAIADAKEMLGDDDPEVQQMARAELAELEPQVEPFEQKIRVLLIPRDPTDEKNAILEIRAGTGGDEAALFAADLFRMYQRHAEDVGWKIEPLSMSETDGGGFKEVIVSVSGQDVFGRLKYEKGVHRVQRVPATESQGRIHTSTCTVAIMPEAEEVDLKIEQKDLKIDVFRSSGPGGQSVNTTDSAVRITHEPTGVVVICQDEKSQHKNKAKAMKVLRSRLYEAQIEAVAKDRADQRRSQVGTGERSEKIRTYNYPQNRITDHRAGFTLHKLDQVMEGAFEELLEGLFSWVATEQEKAIGQGEGEAA